MTASVTNIVLPELLAPAGTLEKLIWAVQYGADAVYFGCPFGSLRAYAGNFTLDDAEKGLTYLHSRSKKGYAALNIYPFSDEYSGLVQLAGQLADMEVDGLIVSDIGLFMELRNALPQIPLHISTQANTTSSQSVLSWRKLGAARVNLARELNLEQIRQICNDVKSSGVQTEVFIHGAVCFSMSGRCAISDYLTGRSANRGECTHPCRWKYAVVEETRPGEFFPVFEDNRGQYLFNSKDLAVFEFIPALVEMGIDSFKIEGRMKSIHYIASVVSLYRRIIDGNAVSTDEALKLLGRVKNRGYTAGFIKGSTGTDDYSYEKSESFCNSIFVANVIPDTQAGTVIEVRNKIFAGETLEMLKPDGSMSQITLPNPLITTYGEQCDFANNSQFVVINDVLPSYSILRRVQSRES